jgi:hypothetical protein
MTRCCFRQNRVTADAKGSIGNKCGSTPIKLPAQTNA